MESTNVYKHISKAKNETLLIYLLGMQSNLTLHEINFGAELNNLTKSSHRTMNFKHKRIFETLRGKTEVLY